MARNKARGNDRGRNQHEVSGSEPRQPLELRRSLRAPGTVVEVTTNALGRFLPRLGGPGVGVRRLYVGVVRSRLLYGAPIWAEDLMASRRSLLKVRRLHRKVSISVVRGFCTISAAAAAVLAGFSPFELQALRCHEIYLHTRGLSDGVGPVDANIRVRARQMTRQPRHESGCAGAKDPRGRLSKLGRLVGRGQSSSDLQGDADAHWTLVLW